MKQVFIAIALVFTCMATLPEASAQSTKEKAPAKKGTYPLYGKVVAVTTRTLTIVRSNSEDAKQSKYTVNSSTEYVNGEKPATIKDVKVGKWIGGTLQKGTGDGSDVVVKINVDAKQKTSVPAKGTAKETEKKPAPKKPAPKKAPKAKS